MTSQIYFRSHFDDNRLTYDPVGGLIQYVTVPDTTGVWKPDLFFSNELKSHHHDVPTENSMYRIYPNGRVTYSSRYGNLQKNHVYLIINLNCIQYLQFNANNCLPDGLDTLSC